MEVFKKISVLILESSQTRSDLLVKVLESEGYDLDYLRVDSRSLFSQALSDSYFNIILCGSPPGGFTLSAALALVRESSLDIPFIIVSQAMTPEELSELMRAGACAYVPINNPARLTSIIESELKARSLADPVLNDGLDGVVALTVGSHGVAREKQMEKALKETAFFLKSSLRIARVGSYLLDIKSGIWRSSKTLDDIFNINESYRRDVAGWLNIVHPAERGDINAYFKNDVLGACEKFDREYRIICQNTEEEKWVHGLGELFFDDSGEPVQMIGTIRDITEKKDYEESLKRSLAQKTVLLKEVHHRVKNNLQVISGLLMLQSRTLTTGKGEEIKEVLNDCRNRVKSMALVHDRIHHNADVANVNFYDCIGAIADGLALSYNIGDRIDIKQSGINVTLAIDQAIPCSLIVSELITNIFKHAFPGQSRGSLGLGITLDLNDVVEVWVSDDGVGLAPGVEWRSPKTIGFELINGLVKQIGGTLELEQRKGCEFRVRFKRD